MDIRYVWNEMGFSQSEIKWDGNTLYLEHGFQKVSVSLDGNYNINGFEDKFQGGIYIEKDITLDVLECMKRTVVYVSEKYIYNMFGFWTGRPSKPSIFGSEEFIKQVNFYLDTMKIRLPYFYEFACDYLSSITQNENMENGTKARLRQGDIFGVCEMKFPEQLKSIYASILHEARHVYDNRHNPKISQYDRELNAYNLTFMAMRDIGFDEEYMEYYIECIEKNVLEPLKK